MPTLTLADRARRYVEKIPGAISGAGGHNQTFTAACALVKGFDLSVDEARSILTEYNQRCDPPWTAAELEHKLVSADRSADDQPRGWLRRENAECGMARPSTSPHDSLPPPRRNAERSEPPKPAPKPEFKGDKLATFAARWRGFVDTAWLADRSALDPFGLSSEDFLRALYQADVGEKVIVFTKDKSQGQALWPDEALPAAGPLGVWFLSQPVDGRSYPNPRSHDDAGKPKMSRRSEESVVDWRYLVIESDQANARDWLGALVQLPLRIAAIYTSGGKSIHALVRVDAPSKHEWDAMMREMKPILVTLGADPKSLTAVRLTRLPGAFREGKRDREGQYVKFGVPFLQKLLFLNPSPAAEPICALPRVRDVLAFWLGWVETLVKHPVSALAGSEDDFEECVKLLAWFESAPAAREALAKLRAWKVGTVG